jgi:hypothetical protein
VDVSRQRPASHRQSNLVACCEASIVRFERCSVFNLAWEFVRPLVDNWHQNWSLNLWFESLAEHRSNPAVAAALDGPNKDWIIGRVAQGIAQAHDGATDPLLKIHKNVAAPKCLTKLLARDHISGTRQQKVQRSKRKILQADPDAVPPQFARPEVGFSEPEPEARA